MRPDLPRTARVEVDDRWHAIAAESEPTASGLASTAWTMPAFFATWIAVGVLASLPLAGRSEDRRAALMTGVGLGPLMLLVAFSDLSSRQAAGDQSPADRR